MFQLVNAATHGGEIVAHRLAWRGKADLSAFKGRRLMLRMALCHADLCSFTL